MTSIPTMQCNNINREKQMIDEMCDTDSYHRTAIYVDYAKFAVRSFGSHAYTSRVSPKYDGNIFVSLKAGICLSGFVFEEDGPMNGFLSNLIPAIDIGVQVDIDSK